MHKTNRGVCGLRAGIIFDYYLYLICFSFWLGEVIFCSAIATLCGYHDLRGQAHNSLWHVIKS